MTALSRRTDRVDRGHARAGSFLDPPGYPTHEFGIATSTNRRPENRGSASLTAAVESPDGFHSETVADARRILDGWEPLPLDSPEIRDWVAQVLGYFRGCYKGETAGPYNRGPWAAESLTIDQERDPLEHVDDHAGVHLVRRFYPDFTPTAADFARAHWGREAMPV